MRVAFDARMLEASGIGTYIFNLLKNFPETIEDIELTLLGNPDKITAHFGDKFGNIRKTNAPIYSVSEQLCIPFAAKGADILHIPHHNVPILWRKKLVVTLHDMLHWDHPEYIPDWRGKIYLKLVSGRIKSATQVICPSWFTASRAKEILGLSVNQITVIHQGVDKEFFSRRSPDAVKQVLSEYGLKPGGYLLYVGNIKPHKNLQRLAEAYSIARKKGIRARLVLTGKLEGLRAKEDVEKLMRFEGVIHIGEVKAEELPYLYSGARALVFISLYEGFGLPPLEAMCCGCPVLVSDAGPLPEVVGDAAITVDPFDVEKIADAIVKIVTDEELRKNLIKRGKEWVKRFSWQKTAFQTIEVYKKVAKL